VVVTEHNTNLAAEISEMLGYLQYQDVARQRIERVTVAMNRRNEILSKLPLRLGQIETCPGLCEKNCFKETQGKPGELSVEVKDSDMLMRELLDEYLAKEACHAPAENNLVGQSGGASSIELF